MFRLGKLIKLRLMQTEECLSYVSKLINVKFTVRFKPVNLKCLRVVCPVVVTNTRYCQKPEELSLISNNKITFEARNFNLTCAA